jgi:phosphoribosylamine--glycine ligase
MHAWAQVVVEEFLTGEEASFFAFCDGKTAIPIAGAQDHKQAREPSRLSCMYVLTFVPV